jgi:exonuclease SbcC
MNITTLQKLSITDFRSISGTVTLPLDASIVLLHGPNGTGKTSVMSALELTLTGQIDELAAEDHEHLLHRGARAATLELMSSEGTLRVHPDHPSTEWIGQLDGEDARFFTERCYLAQRTLGRLLEIYQHAGSKTDSPLTRFVKDLLGLDELDALIDGLEPVKDRRRVKNLVPEYASAEAQIKALRTELYTATAEQAELAEQTEDLQGQIAACLQELDAPGSVDPANGTAVLRRWLKKSDEEQTLLRLSVSHTEIKALRASQATAHGRDRARASRRAEARERTASQAAARWRETHGAALEALLDRLREELPGAPSVLAGDDPAAVHETALQQITAHIERAKASAAADARCAAEIKRLDTEIKKRRGRIGAIDRQLAASETHGVGGELAGALAALAPHIHGQDCPVCGRDYAEVAREPLSAHLAARISELGKQAERLQVLAAARLEAVEALANAKDAREELWAQLLERPAKAAAKATLARLQTLRRQLTAMRAGIAEGAGLIRAATEAERARAAAYERDRTSRRAAASLASISESIGLAPPKETIRLEAAIARLDTHLAGEIKAVQSRQHVRATARTDIQELEELTEAREQTHALIAQASSTLAYTQQAVKALDRRLAATKKLRKDAEASRTRIVRQVFNSSLNRTWRDLFVRLAPEEPFVPAFRVPDAPGEHVSANLETRHRDGRPGGSPAAMLSAGNLNTAALTLFLALHLTAERRLPWLLLDDPVQSMDEVHVAQFAAVLRTLSREHGRRIVIAVHEQALFEYLALELSPAARRDSLITVELSRAGNGASSATSRTLKYRADPVLVAA